MEKKTHSWTTEQQRAIDERGSDLLVSAAAGSGKTAVMIERVFSLISSGESSLDRMLIVTYTNTAAASMREKLRTRLEDAIEQTPDDKTLVEQRRLLDRAHISTLHAYCIQLLRRYYFKTPLSPDFRIFTDSDAASKMADDEAMRTILETASSNALAGNFPEYEEVLLQFSSERSDKGLEDVIRELDKQLSYVLDVKTFRDNVMKRYSDPKGEQYQKDICGYISMRLRLIAEYIETLEHEYAQDANASKIFAYTGELKKHFLDACSEDSLEHIKEQLQPRLPTIPRNVSDSFKRCIDVIKDFNTNIKKTISKDFLSDMSFLNGTVNALFELRESYAEKYEELMLNEGGTTFTGVLRYTLRLFDENPDIVADIRKTLDYIFIDEYQDINELEDGLIAKLSKGDDLFVVGDVKQSIYGFQHARPQLFINKMHTYSEDSAIGKRINLKNNFRSCVGVIKGINFIFGNTMSEDIMEIEYDDDAALSPSPDKGSPQYQGGIMNENGEEPSNELLITIGEKNEDESETIARKIEELVKCTIFDPKAGKRRQVTYGDIVILGRTNAIGNYYEDVFRRHGIPYSKNSSANIKSDARGTLISLLHLMIFKRSDIDLICVMLSCIGGFTETELANVRAANSEGTFYDALTAWNGEPLKTKIASFFAMLDKLRLVGYSMPLPDFLEYIYNETGYIYYVAYMPDGEKQAESVNDLMETARRYADYGGKGIADFVEYYENTAFEKKKCTVGDVGNAVRYMTIHKSKGLEFPIVILAHSDSNREKDKSILRFHENMGISFKAVQADEYGVRSYFNTLAGFAVSQRQAAEQAAEGMRLLYVAATRAISKLIISMCGTENRIKSLCCVPGKATVAGYKQYAELILPLLYRHKDGQPLRSFADGGVDLPYCFTESSWKVTLTQADDKKTRYGDAENIGGDADNDNGDSCDNSGNGENNADVFNKAEYIERARAALDWKYPYIAAVSQRTKQSPSKQQIRTRMKLAHPAFDDKEYKGAQKGTAVHFFMEHVIFDGTAAKLQADKMLANGFLSEEEYNALPLEHIQAFLDSPFGQRMKNAEICRERSFCLIIPFDDAGDDSLVQGIIDCYFFEKDRIVLLDYKTDIIRGDLDEHIAHHTPQLKMYKAALEQLYPQKEVIPYVHFFSVDATVEIK